MFSVPDASPEAWLRRVHTSEAHQHQMRLFRDMRGSSSRGKSDLSVRVVNRARTLLRATFPVAPDARATTSSDQAFRRCLSLFYIALGVPLARKVAHEAPGPTRDALVADELADEAALDGVLAACAEVTVFASVDETQRHSVRFPAVAERVGLATRCFEIWWGIERLCEAFAPEGEATRTHSRGWEARAAGSVDGASRESVLAEGTPAASGCDSSLPSSLPRLPADLQSHLAGVQLCIEEELAWVSGSSTFDRLLKAKELTNEVQGQGERAATDKRPGGGGRACSADGLGGVGVGAGHPSRDTAAEAPGPGPDAATRSALAVESFWEDVADVAGARGHALGSELVSRAGACMGLDESAKLLFPDAVSGVMRFVVEKRVELLFDRNLSVVSVAAAYMTVRLLGGHVGFREVVGALQVAVPDLCPSALREVTLVRTAVPGSFDEPSRATVGRADGGLSRSPPDRGRSSRTVGDARQFYNEVLLPALDGCSTKEFWGGGGEEGEVRGERREGRPDEVEGEPRGGATDAETAGRGPWGPRPGDGAEAAAAEAAPGAPGAAPGGEPAPGAARPAGPVGAPPDRGRAPSSPSSGTPVGRPRVAWPDLARGPPVASSAETSRAPKAARAAPARRKPGWRRPVPPRRVASSGGAGRPLAAPDAGLAPEGAAENLAPAAAAAGLGRGATPKGASSSPLARRPLATLDANARGSQLGRPPLGGVR